MKIKTRLFQSMTWEKRQRTAALQDADARQGALEIPPGFGVRQSSAAFKGFTRAITFLAGCLIFLSSSAVEARDTNQLPLPPELKMNKDVDKLVQIFKKDVERGRLPGMPNVSHYTYTLDSNAGKNSVTINVRPQYNPCTYHYEFGHPSGKRAWRLRRAWRTDVENHVKEYPVLQASEN